MGYFLAPFMIHELLPTLTETALGSHPRCVVSISYDEPKSFHGGNTGSNPVGDANKIKNLLRIGILPEGSKGFDKRTALSSSLRLRDFARQQHHLHQLGLCRPLGRGYRLCICIRRHFVIGVAQQLLDRFHILAIGFHQSAERMPHRMPSHVPRNPGCLQRWLQLRAKQRTRPVRLFALLVWRGKHPIAGFGIRRLQLPSQQHRLSI